VRFYRALISVPIAADDDEEARRLASAYTRGVLDAGSKMPVTTLELLGELSEGSVGEPWRLSWIDGGFFKQQPPESSN